MDARATDAMHRQRSHFSTQIQATTQKSNHISRVGPTIFVAKVVVSQNINLIHVLLDVDSFQLLRQPTSDTNTVKGTPITQGRLFFR